MQELLKQEGFFRKLFDALPVMALIASQRGEVLAVNEVTKNLTGGLPLPETKRGGDVLHCLHTKDDPRGCGFGPYCDTCKIRATALEAIAGQTVKRVKGYLDIEIDGSAERLSLLISASPWSTRGEVGGGDFGGCIADHGALRHPASLRLLPEHPQRTWGLAGYRKLRP